MKAPSAHLAERIHGALTGHDLRLVVLFGSLARGDATANSDLDIAVLADHPLTDPDRQSLVETLALAVDRPVDLIDLRTVGEPLLGRILAEGVRLWERPDAWASLLSRHLGQIEDFVPLQQHILRTRRQAWINR